jgi:hypothetical protein
VLQCANDSGGRLRADSAISRHAAYLPSSDPKLSFRSCSAIAHRDSNRPCDDVGLNGTKGVDSSSAVASVMQSATRSLFGRADCVSMAVTRAAVDAHELS